MRIGIITESFLPQVNGVTNSVLRILETLAQAGHEALVIAPESENGPDHYLGFRVKRIPAIPFHSILPIGMPIALPRKGMEYLLDGFAPDLIHLASPCALGAYGVRVAKRLRVPTLSVYQTDLAGFASHYGLNLAHSTLRKLVGKIHAQTSRTLAPSRSAKAELEGVGVPNVHLWRRGVDSALFHPDKRDEALRQEWRQRGGSAQRTFVGYVGRLANEKRIQDLAILDRDERVQLIITGDGPARKKLERELPNAIFLGFQSGETLARIYASLDLFIHPGPNETFCQAVQEALASGTPCIVPNTGGPADLVTHGQSGFVIDTASPKQLLDAFELFLASDRSEMRIVSRDSVVERTWGKINKQLLEHYEELISNHRHHSPQLQGVAA